MCDRRVIHRCRWMMDDRRRARRARGDADPPRRARRRDRSASFSVAAVARGARGRRRGRRRQRWRAVEGVTDESRPVDASTHASTRRFARRAAVARACARGADDARRRDGTRRRVKNTPRRGRPLEAWTTRRARRGAVVVVAAHRASSRGRSPHRRVTTRPRGGRRTPPARVSPYCVYVKPISCMIVTMIRITCTLKVSW